MDVHFKNVDLDEYTIDDILFSILSLHDARCLSKSPLSTGTLVPLGPMDNQMCFMYAGPNYPSYQILKFISQKVFF